MVTRDKTKLLKLFALVETPEEAKEAVAAANTLKSLPALLSDREVETAYQRVASIYFQNDSRKLALAVFGMKLP